MAFQLQTPISPDEFMKEWDGKSYKGKLPSLPTKAFVLKTPISPDEFMAKYKPAKVAATPQSSGASTGPTISEWHPTFWQRLGEFGEAVKSGFTQEMNRLFGIGSAAQQPEQYLGAPELIRQSTYQPTDFTGKAGMFVGGNVADLPFVAAAGAAAAPVAGALGLAGAGAAAAEGALGGALFGAGTAAMEHKSPAEIAKEAAEQAATWGALGVAGHYVGGFLKSRLGNLLQRAGKTVGTAARDLSTVPTTFRDTIAEAAQANGVPSDILAAVLEHESSFNPHAKGVNTDGSIDRGIAQINSKAHPEVSDEQAFDPNFAINWAAKELKSLYDQTGDWKEALMGYNGGMGAVHAYREGKPYNEDYANTVLSIAKRMGYNAAKAGRTAAESATSEAAGGSALNQAAAEEAAAQVEADVMGEENLTGEEGTGTTKDIGTIRTETKAPKSPTAEVDQSMKRMSELLQEATTPHPAHFQLLNDPTKVWYSMDANGNVYRVKHGEVQSVPEFVHENGEWKTYPGRTPFTRSEFGTKNIGHLDKLLQMARQSTAGRPSGDIFTKAGFKDGNEAVKWAYSETVRKIEEAHPGTKVNSVPARNVAITLAKRLGIKQQDANKFLLDTLTNLSKEGNNQGIITGSSRVPAHSIGNGIGTIEYREGYVGHGSEAVATEVPSVDATEQGNTESPTIMYMHSGFMPQRMQEAIHNFFSDSLARLFMRHPGMPKDVATRVDRVLYGEITDDFAPVAREFVDIMNQVNPQLDPDIAREINYRIDEGNISGDDPISVAARKLSDLIARVTAGETKDGKVLGALRRGHLSEYVPRRPQYYADLTPEEQVIWADIQRAARRPLRAPSIGGYAKHRTLEGTMREIDKQFSAKTGRLFYSHDPFIIYERLETSIRAQNMHKLLDDLLSTYGQKIKGTASIGQVLAKIRASKAAMKVIALRPATFFHGVTLTDKAIQQLADTGHVDILPQDLQDVLLSGIQPDRFVVPTWLANFVEDYMTPPTQQYTSDLAKRLAGIIGLYDKFTSVIRKASLTAPAWHVTNMLLEMISSDIPALTQIPKAIEDITSDSELYHRAVRAGIFHDAPLVGYGTRETRSAELKRLIQYGRTQNPFRSEYWKRFIAQQKGQSNPFMVIINTALQPGQVVTWQSDKVLRMALFRWGALRGLSDDENAATVGSVLHLYNRLTPVEKRIGTRFFYFYDWMKHIVYDIPKRMLNIKGDPYHALHTAATLALGLYLLDRQHLAMDGKHLWQEDTPAHALSIVLGKNGDGTVRYLNIHAPILDTLIAAAEAAEGHPQFVFNRATPLVTMPLVLASGTLNPFAPSSQRIPIVRHPDIMPGIEKVPLFGPWKDVTQGTRLNPAVNPVVAAIVQELARPISMNVSMYQRAATPGQRALQFLGFGTTSTSNPSLEQYMRTKQAITREEATRTYLLHNAVVDAMTKVLVKTGRITATPEFVQDIEDAAKQLKDQYGVSITKREVNNMLRSPQDMISAVEQALQQTSDPTITQRLESLRRKLQLMIKVQQAKQMRTLNKQAIQQAAQ